MGKIFSDLSYNDKVLLPIGRPVDDLKALYTDKTNSYNYVTDALDATETALHGMSYLDKDKETMDTAKGILKSNLDQFEKDGNYEDKILHTKKLAKDLTNKYGVRPVQQNYQQRQALIKSAQERYDKGEISNEKMKRAIRDGDRNYKGAQFDEETGTWSGKYTMRNILNKYNPSEAVVDILDGFKANKVNLTGANGEQIVRNNDGTGYMTTTSKEDVTEADLTEAAKSYLEHSPEFKDKVQDDLYYELDRMLYNPETGERREMTAGDLEGLLNTQMKASLVKGLEGENLQEVIEKNKINPEALYKNIRADQMANEAIKTGVGKESYEKFQNTHLKDWIYSDYLGGAKQMATDRSLMTLNKIGTTQRISPMDMTNIKEGVVNTKASLLESKAQLSALRTKIENKEDYNPQELKELETLVSKQNKDLENLERQQSNIYDFIDNQSNVDVGHHYKNYVAAFNSERSRFIARKVDQLMEQREPKEGAPLSLYVKKYSHEEATKLAVKEASEKYTLTSEKDFKNEVANKYTEEDYSPGFSTSNNADSDKATRYVASLHKDAMGDFKDKEYTQDNFTFVTDPKDTKSNLMWKGYVSEMNQAFTSTPENFTANGVGFEQLLDDELDIKLEDVNMATTKVHPVIETLNGRPAYAIDVKVKVKSGETADNKSRRLLVNFEGSPYGQDEVLRKVVTTEASKYIRKLNEGTLQGHDATIYRKLSNLYISSTVAGKKLDELNIYSAEPGEPLDWEIGNGLNVVIMPMKDIRKEADGEHIDDLNYELRDKHGRVYGQTITGDDTWDYKNNLAQTHMFDNPIELKEVMGGALLKGELNRTQQVRNPFSTSNQQYNRTSYDYNQAGDINIDRVIAQESNGNATVVNEKSGATGLMQLLPVDHKLGSPVKDWNQAHKNNQYTNTDLIDPTVNKQIGKWYLTDRIPQMLGSNNLPDNSFYRLIAYNWGIGNLKTWHQQGANFDTLPKETKNYVTNILR